MKRIRKGYGLMAKELGFLALLSVVAVIATRFLPIPVGEQGYVIIVGVVAVLVGRALGFVVDKVGPRIKAWIIAGSALTFLLSFLLYLRTAHSPPVDCAKTLFCSANILLVWAFGIFGSISLLAYQARVSLVDGD